LLERVAEYHRELEAPPGTGESLRLLAEGASVVVSGQQAGLLGGPFLTIIKALTTIHIADDLTLRTGRPHVPVFWSETDDHDIDEANAAVTLAPDSEPHTLSLPWPESLRESPTGSLPLGQEAERLIDSFFTLSGETAFSEGLRKRLVADLAAAPDFGRWFAKGLLSLLGDRGLIVFDALEERYKEFGRDLWVKVLEDPLRLTAELEAAGDRLSEAGYAPVLSKKKRRCPFFLITGGRREPVFFERGSFRAGERTYTHLEMRRRLDERPGDFSAGVNLRPLLQDHLLPTAVFVGGPTELAYFEQVLPGYEWAGVEAPALVLRPGLTLVEPGVRKTLRRHRTAPSDLKVGVDGVLGTFLRREHRLADPSRWEKLRQSTLRPLQRFAEGLDPEEGEVAELARRAEGNEGAGKEDGGQPPPPLGDRPGAAPAISEQALSHGQTAGAGAFALLFSQQVRPRPCGHPRRRLADGLHTARLWDYNSLTRRSAEDEKIPFFPRLRLHPSRLRRSSR
jgi:bacillithiol biosynthesis cysteine-adding enzyme BshC